MGRVARTSQWHMSRRHPRGRWLLLAWTALLCAQPPVAATDIVIYSFEGTPEGWMIPDWAKTSHDYVATELTVTQEQAHDGAHALKLQATFPGGRWTGAYVERELEVTDWSQFGRLSVDVYVPPYAPPGLTGKMILTIGEQWAWTEMNRTVPLAPGTWTTMTVNLKPGSMDWKYFPDEQFRRSVRKLGVRIESNQKPQYSGPVYLDGVRLAE